MLGDCQFVGDSWWCLKRKIVQTAAGSPGIILLNTLKDLFVAPHVLYHDEMRWNLWDFSLAKQKHKLHNCMYPRTCVFNVHVPLDYFHTCIIYIYTVHILPYQESFASQFSTNSIYFEPLAPLTLVESSHGPQEVQSSSSIVGLLALVNLQFMPDSRTFTHKNIALGATWFTEKKCCYWALAWVKLETVWNVQRVYDLDGWKCCNIYSIYTYIYIYTLYMYCYFMWA